LMRMASSPRFAPHQAWRGRHFAAKRSLLGKLSGSD
jgi:hypothetical protein